MKVGLMIKKPNDSIFENGCVQQTIFVKEVLLNGGIDCDLITISPNYDKFDEIYKETVVKIKDLKELKGYDMIMQTSLVLNPNINNVDKAICEYIKKNGIKLTEMICGNLWTLHQEELVFKVHDNLKNYGNNYVDEYWLLEMYEFMKDYMTLLTKKPVRILPYVWDPWIIESLVEKKMDAKTFTKNAEKCDKNNENVNILIYEPNLSIHKNSLIPLLIAENYYVKYGNVNKVYIFGGMKLTELNKIFLDNLKLKQDNKIECYDRWIMPMSLDIIQKQNTNKNVILSYTHMNNLNFLHLELFKLGYPIVHNCEKYKENGLYYNDHDLVTGIECIKQAREHYRKDIHKRTKPILQKFTSKNKKIIKKWKENIYELVADKKIITS